MRLYTRKGFTLIELLVVIAVISVIAAILFPVFAKVREKARQTVCISNARQMGIALQEYATDNDDHFMTRHDNDAGDVSSSGIDPNPADFQTWYDWVQPYISSYDVQRCPSYSGVYPIPNIAGSNTRYVKSTYLISDNIVSNPKAVGSALANIPNPASTIIVAESPSGGTSFADASFLDPGPTAVDYLFCPGSVSNGPGEMHFVQYAANQTEPLCFTPAISAQVTCIAVDGHAKSVQMNDANDGGVTEDNTTGCVHDPAGGYGGLYFTGPDGELTIPTNPSAPDPCLE